MAAGVVANGFIAVSKDAGTTWTSHYGIGQCYSIASSTDGTKLVSANGGFGIYTSIDSGTNWTQTSAPINFSWVSVASSADGTKLVAAEAAGSGIYTSTNSGTTWTQTSAPLLNWRCVASSADGVKLSAASASYNTGAGIYTRAIRTYPTLGIVILTNTPSTTVVAPSANNLMFGQNYQLQIANDLKNWMDFGVAFTATNTNWMPANYWNVVNTNQLFFRLKMF